MNHLALLRLAASAVLAVPALSQAMLGGAIAQEGSGGGASGIFDQRYCEILVAERRMLTLQVTVYNTIGLNDCPQDAWESLDATALAAELGVTAVIKNGPRHWTIDGILGRGMSTSGPTVAFGDILMTQRATFERKLTGGLEEESYVPQEIARDTTFIFGAGKPVFELTDPAGNVYMMQSYALTVDPGLALADLAGMGSRLELPEGWVYSTRVLEDDYPLVATGMAMVVRDVLHNTYQRRPAAR